MKSTEQYLDEVKERLDLPSDYALAKVLGLARTALSNYRVGRSMPDDLACVRIAEAIGCEPMEVIAAINYQRAKTDVEREIWEGLWGKAAGAIVWNSPASKAGSSVAPSSKAKGSGKAGKADDRSSFVLCKIVRPSGRRAANDARRFAA